MEVRINAFSVSVLFFIITAIIFWRMPENRVYAYEGRANESINDAYSTQTGKLMYTHCKSALDESSAKEFKSTACYAHVMGTIGMLGLLFHVEAYAVEENLSTLPYERALNDAICSVKGKTAREIAISYVNAIEHYNSRTSGEDDKEYVSLPHLLMNKQLCEPFFSTDK